jgi:hypothetical protein
VRDPRPGAWNRRFGGKAGAPHSGGGCRPPVLVWSRKAAGPDRGDQQGGRLPPPAGDPLLIIQQSFEVAHDVCGPQNGPQDHQLCHRPERKLVRPWPKVDNLVGPLIQMGDMRWFGCRTRLTYVRT